MRLLAIPTAAFALLALGWMAEPLKVRSITLGQLVKDSDVIGEARITSVELIDGRKLATARMENLWKGDKLRDVTFWAYSTWACGISTAVEGEKVVLFLGKQRKDTHRYIRHSGRGRMPIRVVNDMPVATIWTGDVRLPEGIPTLPGPDPKYTFIQSVAVSILNVLVLNAVHIQQLEEDG